MITTPHRPATRAALAVATGLAVLLLGIAGCSDDGARIQDSPSGSGSGSGTGSE